MAVTPVEGGVPTHILPVESTHSGRVVHWVPDGRSLTFIDGVGGASNISLQPLDNGPRRQLTSFTSGTMATFDWSSDGSKLAWMQVSEVRDTADAFSGATRHPNARWRLSLGEARMTTDYTALSLADVSAEFSTMAGDAQSAFGLFDEHQLNWRPDAASWSVAQCFDHLLNADRAMFQAVDAAMDASNPRTVWQRLPVVPRILGLMMIKSQTPQAKRKFTASHKAEPVQGAIDSRIIGRFVAYQHEAAARVRSLDGRDVARVIMVSPFVPFIVYSVLDGCRLIVTHQRRHFEQARRVTQRPGFPSRRPVASP